MRHLNKIVIYVTEINYSSKYRSSIYSTFYFETLVHNSENYLIVWNNNEINIITQFYTLIHAIFLTLSLHLHGVEKEIIPPVIKNLTGFNPLKSSDCHQIKLKMQCWQQVSTVRRSTRNLNLKAHYKAVQNVLIIRLIIIHYKQGFWKGRQYKIVQSVIWNTMSVEFCLCFLMRIDEF